MVNPTIPDGLPRPVATDGFKLLTFMGSLADAIQTALNRRGPVTVANAAERDARFPNPVQGDGVFRSDLGHEERYYGAYSASTNPNGRTLPGWYVYGMPVVSFVQDTRTAPMNVGPGVDHNAITITLPRAGRWLVEAQGTFEANATGTRRSLLKVDGVIVASKGVAPSSSSGAGMNISDIVTANAGSTLAFNVVQTSAGVLPLLADAGTWRIALRAHYLSPA